MACTNGHRKKAGAPNSGFVSAVEEACQAGLLPGYVCRFADLFPEQIRSQSYVYNVESFCQAGPPPAINSIDASDLLNPFGLIDKLTQWAKRKQFNEWCECSPGGSGELCFGDITYTRYGVSGNYSQVTSGPVREDYQIRTEVWQGSAPHRDFVRCESSGQYRSTFAYWSDPTEPTGEAVLNLRGSGCGFAVAEASQSQWPGEANLITNVVFTVDPNCAPSSETPEEAPDLPDLPPDTPPPEEAPDPIPGPTGDKGDCPTIAAGPIQLVDAEIPSWTVSKTGECSYQISLQLPDALKIAKRALALALANSTAISVLSAGLAALTKTVAILSAQVARNWAAIQASAKLIARNWIAIQALRQALQKVLDLANEAKRLADNALLKAGLAFDFAKQLQSYIQNVQFLAKNALEAAKQALNSVNKSDSALLRKLLSIALGNSQKLSGSGGGAFDLTPCEPGDDDPVSAPYSGSGLSGVYAAIAGIEASLNTIHSNTKCSDDIAALPMFYELKHGEISQLVVVWKKVEKDGSAWSMTIPHPREDVDQTFQFNFPDYLKGGNLATVRLIDNSQIRLNVFSLLEAEKVIGYISTLLDPVYVPEAGLSITYSENVANYAEVLVRAEYIKRFNGHKTTVPVWGRRILA